MVEGGEVVDAGCPSCGAQYPCEVVAERGVGRVSFFPPGTVVRRVTAERQQGPHPRYACVRRTLDTGREWVDAGTVALAEGLALAQARRDDAQAPWLARDIPVVRVVEVAVLEVRTIRAFGVPRASSLPLRRAS